MVELHKRRDRARVAAAEGCRAVSAVVARRAMVFAEKIRRQREQLLLSGTVGNERGGRACRAAALAGPAG